ncbi:acyltransferase family protein [Pleurocapsales cyanobacterium LEGE 06147]|nr:acyltransferase family protein [Pleurocapsales cyanobacterium LEGE 06147]
MLKQQRLTGVDLFRGIAVYAVIILHSDEGIPVLPAGWAQILEFSCFAVPFFLATSFYLAIAKIYASGRFQLNLRLQRLLIPYAFWSVFYLCYKAAKYLVSNQPERLYVLSQDPFALIFCGGAAFHLYFLSLLITGTILIKFVEIWIKNKIELKVLTSLFVLSLIGYEILIVSDNNFSNISGVAFQSLLNSILPSGNFNPLLRLILVVFAWTIRCLPYIFLALLLNHPRLSQYLPRFNRKNAIALLLIFLTLNIFGNYFLPQGIEEVIIGYAALLSAIYLSVILPESLMILNLGVCSFGIYLIHLLIVEIFQMVSKRVYPILLTQPSLFSLLIVVTLTFLISWMLTSISLKRQLVSRWKLI